MRTIKYILTAFAILVCSVAIGQNPVDTVNVQSKVKSRGRVRKVKPEPVLLDSLEGTGGGVFRRVSGHSQAQPGL